MILGNVNDISTMIEINPKFIAAIQQALKQSPITLENGSYPIEDDNVYMNVMSVATQQLKIKNLSYISVISIFKFYYKVKNALILVPNIMQ